MSMKDIQFVAKNFPKKKIPGLDGFTGEFQKTIKKEILSILHKLLWKIRGETISQSFTEASITPIQKSKTLQQRNFKPNSLMKIEEK